jgi:hypothetical protein
MPALAAVPSFAAMLATVPTFAAMPTLAAVIMFRLGRTGDRDYQRCRGDDE